ncbi:Transcriptional adapter ada2 [Phlyctochytrium planicorne]|nr:Transcriptional adapter ada2 [Phlyctochytrium planicorne]
MDFPLFTANWTAQEELALVDGLRTYGIGNWEQISDHIGTKDKYEVGKHYEEVYVNQKTWPMPDMNVQFDKSTSRKLVVRDPNPPVRKPFRAATSGPVNHEIGGFMPGRDEFEYEFDNDAEGAVKDMVFEDNEPSEEVSLKTTILNIYNTALDRRKERKKFIKDRGLTTDFRKILNNEKKRPKEEKDLLNRIRVFAKIQTSDDFEKFSDDEQKLRARISQLQEYRRMGITTFREANEYDREKFQRSTSLKSSFGFSSLRYSRKFDEISPPRHPSLPITRQASTAHSLSLPAQKRSAAPLDVSSADGIDMLLANEQQLCSTLRILPRAYLVIKETLLREHATRGSLKRREARELIKIDVNKTSQIYDLFVANGWIKAS